MPRSMWPRLRGWIGLALACLAAVGAGAKAGELRWEHLSSSSGALPVPGESTEQTAAIVCDLDRDGLNDFVLGFRKTAPALVWYRRGEAGWTRQVIEPAYLTIEAGGAARDLDGDGDLDLVFGSDYQGAQVWWWENPSPQLAGSQAWKRHLVKDGGEHQHHDQVFLDVPGQPRGALAFWNQGAQTLFLAPVPENPRTTEPWPFQPIHKAQAVSGGPPYVEGLSTADIDGDGRSDLLAGNGWLKTREDGSFGFTPIAAYGGRIVAGHFAGEKVPQVVIAPGDGVGPLMYYECEADPAVTASWKGRKLLDRDLIHGHTLETGDVDGDGKLDLLAAEMAKWTERRPDADHPEATAWILLGDGRGQFRVTKLAQGIDFHEARLADLDGDGDLDVLDKPYNWNAPRIDAWLNNGTGPRRVPAPR